MMLSATTDTRRWFPWFKWTVYGLLAINVVLFLYSAEFVEWLDALAWVALLLLFEWETSRWERYDLPKWEIGLAHGLRFLAYGVVLYSAYGYSEQAFVDDNGPIPLWNACTWILIVAVLEYDVWIPGRYMRWEWRLRNMLKALLYGSLLAYALLWAAAGDWLDFYDAMLWMLCFFAVELNIFDLEAPVDPEMDALEAEAPAGTE